MILIDKYAYISAMKDVNPLMKILFGGVGLIGCIGSRNLVSYTIVFATMFCVAVLVAKISVGYYLKMLTLPLVFLMFSVIGIVVEWQTTAPKICVLCLQIGHHYLFVSDLGTRLAFGLVCKSMAAVSCLYMIILTTPVRDVIHFMVCLKCPRTIITLSVLTYQFIFLLMEIAATKMKSQLSRGGYRAMKHFPKTFAMLWGSVFIQSRLKCEWIHKSMSSRGYDGHLPLMKKKLRLNAKELAILLLFFAAVMFPNFYGMGQ